MYLRHILIDCINICYVRGKYFQSLSRNSVQYTTDVMIWHDSYHTLWYLPLSIYESVFQPLLTCLGVEYLRYFSNSTKGFNILMLLFIRRSMNLVIPYWVLKPFVRD